MAHSPDPVADRLAKRLYQYVAQAVQSDPAAGHEMHRRGLLDFVRADRPDTHDPVHMAAELLLYAGVDEGRKWRRFNALIQGILVFLHDATRIRPTPLQLKELAAILNSATVDTHEVHQWFDRVYR